MKTILALLGALFVIPILIRLGAQLFVRTVVVKTAESIGRQAVDQQPDHIHLTRRGPQVWANAGRAEALANPLLATGFEDAGTYAIDEMPNIYVRLLVDANHSITAAIYEHPRAGQWLELTSRYVDGTSASFNTLKATGLQHRPGHQSVNAPGLEPAALLERSLSERPQKALVKVNSGEVVSRFEDGYAQGIAWRKRRGVSAAEVVQVASQRKAA